MTLSLPIEELFGSCRSLVQREALDVSERAELWTLLQAAAEQDPRRYVEEWIPYLSEFSSHWGRPLVMLDDVHKLSDAREIAPFARFTINLETMHRWLLENTDMMALAADLETFDEIEQQETSVALWMEAFDPVWEEQGDRFEVFAMTSSGAMVTAWYRPGKDVLEEPEIVLFGDGGELEGIATSLESFALLLGQTFDPYDPSRPLSTFELMPNSEELRLDFRRRVEMNFGALPPRKTLLEPLAELTASLEAWVDQFSDD